MWPLVCKLCWKHCSTPILSIRHFDSPLMLLDPKEDVRLQSPMMEIQTDSGVNEGNYCMVYSATILTSAINIKISSFKLNYLYTLVIFYLHLLQVWSGRFTKDYDCSFILVGAATEAAQPKPVLQYRSMSASA